MRLTSFVVRFSFRLHINELAGETDTKLFLTILFNLALHECSMSVFSLVFLSKRFKI
jgi:hypothetical protein